ncbi:MAG: hypothetical protein QNJ34_19055 [Xenococcaceae cyanobacterium MO_188.B29]|nr:hypothetical protein [Xenococcaceae cyanobacterium MO_188.B29]
MNKKITISKFQQVFFTVLFLTLLSGGTSLWLADKENLSEQQNRIFETTTMTWNMGIGVIFGLLGGKATTDFYNKKSRKASNHTISQK